MVTKSVLGDKFSMKAIKQTLSTLHLGDVSVHQNMAVMSILSSHAEIADYLTLDEALSKKSVHIKELSEEGVVPQLLLINEGAKPILLLDGEELLGAKQNRLINLTILAPAKQSITIPVSCVEAGRWHHQSEHFTASESMSFHEVRAKKAYQVSASLRSHRGHHSDQLKIWDSIDRKACSMDTPSATSAMSEIFRRYDDSLDSFCEAFSVTENQVGALFAINGEIMGFEFFDASSTLEKTFPKLIKSYALDAIEKQPHPSIKKVSANTIEEEEAKEFLQIVSNCEFESYPAVGLGEDVRFSIKGLCGGGLIDNDRVIHLCAFKINSSENRTQHPFDGDNDCSDILDIPSFSKKRRA